MGFSDVDSIIKELMTLTSVCGSIASVLGANQQRRRPPKFKWMLCNSFKGELFLFCFLNLGHRTSRTIKGDNNSGLG